MTRHDLENGGPPIRLSVLTQLTGWSRFKLYRDIERGYLAAGHQKCGTRRYVMVARGDALRYLDAIDFRWSSTA